MNYIRNNSNRKGQITIFIILGIVILFLVALGVYWQNSFNKIRPPVQQVVVDSQVKPVQIFVTDCLSSISKEALIRLGQNGGYIEIPQGLKVDPVRTYNSDALLFEPQVMPYWYYMKPCESSTIGCLVVRDPYVCEKNMACVLPYKGDNSMESQLNKYIENNIMKCLDNFSTFNDRFDIRAKSNPKVESQVTETGVSFKMDYPLTVTMKGSTKYSEIPYTYTEQDIKLKEIYEFAQEIRDAEMNYTFLERNTLNLITVYSGMSSEKLPPMSNLEIFSQSKRYWIKSEVKQKLMNDILPYTMLLQISNAGNAKQLYSTSTDPKTISFEDGLYQAMMLQVSNKTHFGLDANIYYPPGSEIYFKIAGNGEIIKPKNFDSGDNILMKMMSIAMNDYSFKYDLTYPVIVTLSDPEAFKGEGYSFSYAMQANIRKNVPITSNITPITVVHIPTIDIDNMNQRLNRTITIEAIDKYTKEPLDEVIISYRCGDTFDIGLTEKTFDTKGKSLLVEKFPFCQLGGEIIYEKSGYIGGAIDYDNNFAAVPENDPKTFKIELWPLQEKHIKVYKRTSSDINSIRSVGVGGIVLYNTAYSEISSQETVFLNIAREKEDSRETDVPLVGFTVVKSKDSKSTNSANSMTRDDQIAYVNKLYADGMINVSDRDALLADLNLIAESTPEEIAATNAASAEQVSEYVLDFAPGSYLIDAFMMYEGNITIPKSSETFCTGPEILGVCTTGTKNLDYPEQNFTSWINGGVKTDFYLTEADVYSNSTLVFYIAEMPLPNSWKTLESAPTIEQYQEDKLALLRPTVQ